ncbi:MAG: hypothetical protein IPL58_14485 [Betaproteobacteria bacterium]|uniref:Uncharacterized protein n=1 Tax=Candidatus Proximibacter danicus TaxID=2954365 RepID=A0A9D7K252_9PROT|nr:hypothetical protein [Candidatus Proximibacter danicus]
MAEAPQWFEPELILVAKEASTEPAAGEPEEIAGFTAEKKEFGFQWFITGAGAERGDGTGGCGRAIVICMDYDIGYDSRL